MQVRGAVYIYARSSDICTRMKNEEETRNFIILRVTYGHTPPGPYFTTPQACAVAIAVLLAACIYI